MSLGGFKNVVGTDMTMILQRKTFPNLYIFIFSTAQPLKKISKLAPSLRNTITKYPHLVIKEGEDLRAVSPRPTPPPHISQAGDQSQGHKYTNEIQKYEYTSTNTKTQIPFPPVSILLISVRLAIRGRVYKSQQCHHYHQY